MTTLVEDGLPVGIRRAELPLPFPVGPVNCWVLLGNPVTVVDPGMLFEDSLDLLGRTMAAVRAARLAPIQNPPQQFEAVDPHDDRPLLHAHCSSPAI